jgi:hypothetical protein
MVMSYNAGPELGTIEVHTTEEGGHPPSFWAKLCVEKMIQTGDDTPQEIKNQVKTFKNNIEKLIEEYMQNAIKSDRITINNKLDKEGLTQASDLIRKL